MKYLYVLFGVVLIGCHTKQKIISDQKIDSSVSICPENGSCSFDILENKSMNILKDGIGMLYPDITEGNKILVKFEYKKNKIQNTADSHYNELIYAEFDSNLDNLSLKDEDLKKVKLLFARLCFCRGQTGYYNISNGSLNITKINKGVYTFNLDFKIDEVPQIISKIRDTIRLNP